MYTISALLTPFGLCDGKACSHVMTIVIESNVTKKIIIDQRCDAPPLTTPLIILYAEKRPRGYSLLCYIGGSCHYFESEILQENYIRGLRAIAYDKLEIWSLRIETKLQKKTKF